MKPAWMLAAIAVTPLAASAPPRAGAPVQEIVVNCPTEGLALEDLLHQAQQVTGEAFFYDPKEVKDVRIHFMGPIKIAPASFLAFLDRCLADDDYVHLESKEFGQTTHTLLRVQGSRTAPGLKARASLVAPEDVLKMGDRGILVTTYVTPANIPAREAVNTLQQYFAEQATETIRNIEGTNLVVMTGRASHIADVLRLLSAMDARAQATPNPRTLEELDARLHKVEAALSALQRHDEKPAGR